MYVPHSWKGYDFNVLDRLAQKGYIAGSRTAKPVILTDEGVRRAEEQRRKLLNNANLFRME